MAKSDVQKRLEEELQKALEEEDTPVVKDMPTVLYVKDAQDIEGNTVLQVVEPDAFDIDTMGIPLVFPLSQLDIMQARTLAFGVTLERRYS